MPLPEIVERTLRQYGFSKSASEAVAAKLSFTLPTPAQTNKANAALAKSTDPSKLKPGVESIAKIKPGPMGF